MLYNKKNVAMSRLVNNFVFLIGTDYYLIHFKWLVFNDEQCVKLIVFHLRNNATA